jgi:hypothetical protein
MHLHNVCSAIIYMQCRMHARARYIDHGPCRYISALWQCTIDRLAGFSSQLHADFRFMHRCTYIDQLMQMHIMQHGTSMDQLISAALPCYLLQVGVIVSYVEISLAVILDNRRSSGCERIVLYRFLSFGSVRVNTR